MTITSTQNRVSYSGNGSTTAFSVPFRFLASADLVVLVRVDATGVETTKSLDSHYSVSGAGAASGGSVTALAGSIPQTGETLIIYGNPAMTQLVDYIAGGVFPAESHEEALDRLTLQSIRTRELVDRPLNLTESSTDGSGEYDANGNSIINATKVTGLVAPLATTDATSKTYVDVAITNAGLTPPTGLIATGSITSRLLADRWAEFKNVKDFGAVGDGIADDTAAIKAAIASGETSTAYVLYFPAGRYVISDQLIFSPTVRVQVRGAGVGQTKLEPTSFGGNKSIFLQTNSYPGGSYTFAMESIEILGNFLNREDPIGVQLVYPNDCRIENCSFSELGNTAILWHSPVNCAINKVRVISCGTDTMTNSDLVSGSIPASGTTFDATGTPFSASDVGREIHVSGAGYEGGLLLTTVASHTDSNTVELTDAAITTVSTVRASFGGLTGSITAGNKTLTVDSDDAIFTAADIGRFIYVEGASRGTPNATVIATQGSTMMGVIASVTSGVIVELSDNADITVSAASVYMTPGIAMTQTQLARTGSSGGQTNDVVTSETTVELYHGGPAYLVYYGIQVYLNNAKAHGMSPSVNGRSGSSGNAYVVESISGCTISGEVDYGAKLNSGHLLVGGASTKVLWRDFVIYASAPSNFGLVHVTSGHTDTRVLLGPGYSNTRRTAHPVVYGANAQDDAVRSGGHVLRRFETDSQQTVTELVAAISSNAQKSIADDAFVVITPPQNVKVGILVLWSSANSTSSILRFRTTASGYGVHMEGVALASNCEVATGDLTGTAGTDVKVTVSAATDGTIHVENRIGYGAVFSWLFLGTPGI